MAPPPPARPPSSYGVLDEHWQFIAQHGNDPLFAFRRTPMDITNRLSVVLIAAAVVGARRFTPAVRRSLWAMAALGALMVMGPYLRWGDEIVSIGGNPIPLPFRMLSEIHPFLARLTWPERWGIVIPLALIPLAARVPRPGIWATVIAFESFLLSANLPLKSISLRHEQCWADLSANTGAILELPLRRPGLRIPRVGVHRRFYERPVAGPMLLPPGVHPPEDWTQWQHDQPLLEYLHQFESGRSPNDPGAAAVTALIEAGIGAIALDVEPGVFYTAAQLNRVRAVLGRHLGAPTDLGCAWVWWMDPNAAGPVEIDDGNAWRESASQWKEENPDPILPTLIQPTWDAVGTPMSPTE